MDKEMALHEFVTRGESMVTMRIDGGYVSMTWFQWRTLRDSMMPDSHMCERITLVLGDDA